MDRLHDNRAGIIILATLAIISLVDVISRNVILRESVLDISNVGEPLITALVSLMLIAFAIKGKDRIVYVLGGGWLAYFCFKQLFDLPGMVMTFLAAMENSDGFTDFAILIHVFTMVCFIAIGGLLVEYMNDGSIYNKPFNILCIAIISMLAINIFFAIYDIFVLNDVSAVIAIFNNLSRAMMLFLFTFFAYGSAKNQLRKVRFTE